MTKKQMRAAVRRGARLLDKARPGWARRVKIRPLNLSDCKECVLGQEYGGYTDGTDRLGLTDIDSRQHYGFTLRYYREADWPGLTDLWKDEIRGRRVKTKGTA